MTAESRPTAGGSTNLGIEIAEHIRHDLLDQERRSTASLFSQRSADKLDIRRWRDARDWRIRDVWYWRIALDLLFEAVAATPPREVAGVVEFGIGDLGRAY